MLQDRRETALPARRVIWWPIINSVSGPVSFVAAARAVSAASAHGKRQECALTASMSSRSDEAKSVQGSPDSRITKV
jgi:hypothetical protein